ncbi:MULTISPECIES: hypothetical protein [unclassified Xanthomonas]|uniref:hypothetical protein n=1 Tax=Xanthomonas sp. LMG 9002 TaxID=1591158 RepID=UPI001F24848B|nr:hypothetical protein [Xanthomonas sp. LMG 9002]
MRWKEQVWLSDGRRIEVERYSVALKSGFPDSRNGPQVYQRISYSPMGVYWESDRPVGMLSFDIFDNSAYLITDAGGRREDFCRGKMRGTYLARIYRWREGVLQEIEQGDAPIARMRINLSGMGNWMFRDASPAKTYFSWDDIAFATGQPSKGPPELVSKFFNSRSSYAVCN